MSDRVLDAAMLDYGLAMESRKYPDAAAALRVALKCNMDDLRRTSLQLALASVEEFVSRCSTANPSRSRRPLDPSAVINQVCRELGVTSAEVFGIGRHPSVVLARGLIWTILRRHSNLLYPEIARATMRPNHSTVITGHKRFEAMLADPIATCRITPGHVIDPRALITRLELALGLRAPLPACMA